MSDGALWYYLEGGSTPRGPVPAETLAQWLREGRLPADTLVAAAGGSEWRPAREVLPGAPPTLPPLPPLPSLPTPAPRPVAPARAAAPLPAPASEVAVELRCVAGPDAGKSFWIGPTTVALDHRAGLIDPYLGEVHAVLELGRVRLRVARGPAMARDGQPLAEVALAAGEQIQIGSSLWQVASAPVGVADLLAALGNRLNRLASVEKLEGFSLREMFSEVFTHRTSEQIDDYFLVGTARTTPPLSEVQTGWPKPWLFGRVLLFLGAVYAAFVVAILSFENPRLLPGLILMGSIAMPFATLILFYELNSPRNVSFRTVLTLFFLGGVVSLFVSLIGFTVADLPWLGASSAGIIEESGKLLTVIAIARGPRHRFLLNGLLFGAAVGAGFAAFESAGYAFWDALMAEGTIEATTRLILIRAVLSPFGHVAWTAIAAGALWRVKGGRAFSPSMLADPGFLKTMLIPVGLHMIWNSPLPSPLWSKHIVLGVISWYVLFGLVQQGLRQVKKEQTETTRQQIESTRSFIRPAVAG